mgnify:CR=1 FL=1
MLKPLLIRSSHKECYYEAHREPDTAGGEVIYTDGIHLVADSIDELHTFAKSIGFKRDWFQWLSLPHYDITSSTMRKRVIKAGAIETDSRTIVKIARMAA